MVPTIYGIESWAIAITILVTAVAILILIVCLCWEEKRKNLQQFYILDEDGLQKVSKSDVEYNSKSDIKLFRRFSTGGKAEPNPSFTSAQLPICKLFLNESTDKLLEINNTNQFENSVLKVDTNSQNDDCFSCDSGDSRFTFYSSRPQYGRAISTTSDTYLSVCEPSTEPI